MPHRPRHSRDRSSPAFTIVESAVSVVIVGVMLVAAFSVVAAAAKSNRLQWELRAREVLGRALLEEMRQVAYSGPAATNVGVQVNLLGLITVNLGGTAADPLAGRMGFDDLDDFNGYTDQPPTTRAGDKIAGYSGWRRRVTVERVDPANPAGAPVAADAGLKRITIEVTAPSGKKSTLTTFRSAWSPFQREDRGVITGIELALTADGVSIHVPTALVNQPPQ